MAQRLASSDPSSPSLSWGHEKIKTLPGSSCSPFRSCGLSMMKLPFHTTAKSTARLLMSILSYWYCGERGRGHMACEVPYHRGSGMLLALRGTRATVGRTPGILTPSALRKEHGENQGTPSAARIIPMVPSPTPSHECQQCPAQTP